jgi:hypothetical protein
MGFTSNVFSTGDCNHRTRQTVCQAQATVRLYHRESIHHFVIHVFTPLCLCRRCGCDDCIRQSQEDSLRFSVSRLNEYRALASPSLIALSSNDPILTAFRLSWELRNLAFAEKESKSEYMASIQVQTLACMFESTFTCYVTVRLLSSYMCLN